jgi:hypothetical protein
MLSPLIEANHQISNAISIHVSFAAMRFRKCTRGVEEKFAEVGRTAQTASVDSPALRKSNNIEMSGRGGPQTEKIDRVVHELGRLDQRSFFTAPQFFLSNFLVAFRDQNPSARFLLSNHFYF